jgi:alkaline phosphatase D
MTEISRRRVLKQSAALSMLPLIGAGRARAAPASPLFTLGVASGDPLPDGVVIWTRLAPDPLNGGGMPPQNVPVRWEVAEDEGMRRIVQQGEWPARLDMAHAIRREVGGLEPGRHYWYRFNALGQESPIGRTRTAPTATNTIERLHLAVACCQNYQHGYYTAHRHMAQEDVDLVLFLGDYIYEDGIKDDMPRKHNSAAVATLEAYRNRYALYKLDPDLQAAHAAFPWAAVPDDHEVANDYAGDHPGSGAMSRVDFLARRAAAYQAYYEHMPFRAAARPHGTAMRLHRTLRFGNLATVHLLDTRQHRTVQPCGGKWQPRCPAAADPNATILGEEQEAWLYEKLAGASAQWTVLAQQVPIMQRRRPHDGGPDLYHHDKWDGYLAARERLFAEVRKHDMRGLIALSGDVHNNWAGALKANFDDPQSDPIGSEFVATSIASNGDGEDSKKSQRRIADANPHIAFYNGQRGYLRCVVSPDTWRTDFRVVPYISKPGAPVTTRASFVVERASRRMTSG